METLSTKCEEFNGCKNACGYGEKTYKGKKWLAHRLAYKLAYGDFDLRLCVLHKCDNPSCVNPEHLWLGTQVDNIADMDKKGRRKVIRGTRHPKAKLSEQDVEYIRSSNLTYEQLAEKFDVSTHLIYRVKSKKGY